LPAATRASKTAATQAFWCDARLALPTFYETRCRRRRRATRWDLQRALQISVTRYLCG